MKPGLILSAILLASVMPALDLAAQSPPPAPALVEPASGAALVQPMTLRWSPVVDPDGPIVSYTWQLGTSSAFSVVIAAGFTDLRHGDPVPTFARVSGVPNGSYFWRVKATQQVGGAVGFVETAWSAVRSVSITGLGPAPGTPAFTSPASGARFHALENFEITWQDTPGAHYYLLEADDQPTFSHPLALTINPMVFGTRFGAGWGNPIPNIYYRVVAVSVDNVRGLPSPTLNVQITNSAPVPPAPVPLSPIGTTVALPFTFDWSDTPNPQIAGYDLDVDDDLNFDGDFGVLLVQNISRSDYTVVSDLAPGNYFWRVRAIHGAVAGPWSAGRSVSVAPSPPTPLDLLWLRTEPSSTSGGHSTQARVTLSAPAPPGGAVVKIASDLPHAEVPDSVFIPAGATDAVVSPITTIPVDLGIGIVGTLRAAYGAGNWEQSSLGVSPLFFDISLNKDSVIGGTSLMGTATLKRPAPAGGIDVTLISTNTGLVRPPAHVLVPEGETAASFAIATSPVSVSTPITIHAGTANDGYQSPGALLILTPPGSPAPAPSLSSVTVSTDSISAGGSTTGTVTLTGPAPPGGAAIWLVGSMEGDVVTPVGGVTVPAGSLSVDFPITAPQVIGSHWVMIQARYGNSAGMHAAVLRIDPAFPAIPDVLTLSTVQPSVVAGDSVRGTVGLVTPAPPGGTTVFLSSDDPAAQLPASVFIAGGNSANSFTVTTTATAPFTSASISATTGAVTKSVFLTIFPNPNAGVTLSAVTPSVTSTTGGTSISATVSLSGAAPAGGASVTLSTSNAAAAQVPATVTVPAGQSSRSFTITTFAVTANTPVTITGTFGGSTRSAAITVLAGSSSSNTGFLSPGANAADSGGDGNGFEGSAANAHGDDTAAAVDNNSGTASSTSCTSSGRDKHRFFNYGLALPSGATVRGIEVRLDARVDNTSGSPRMCVQLSWNGGVSWTAAQTTSTLSTTMATRTLGSATNTWGRTWTAAELSNANFRVRVITVANSTSRDFSLDWIAVRVSYQGGASASVAPQLDRPSLDLSVGRAFTARHADRKGPRYAIPSQVRRADLYGPPRGPEVSAIGAGTIDRRSRRWARFG